MQKLVEHWHIDIVSLTKLKLFIAQSNSKFFEIFLKKIIEFLSIVPLTSPHDEFYDATVKKFNFEFRD